MGQFFKRNDTRKQWANRNVCVSPPRRTARVASVQCRTSNDEGFLSKWLVISGQLLVDFQDVIPQKHLKTYEHLLNKNFRFNFQKKKRFIDSVFRFEVQDQ